MFRLIYNISILWEIICVQCILMELYNEEIWDNIACDEEFFPDHCDYNNTLDIRTLDDFDRCGPARLSLAPRNYFLGASGRKETYKDNKEAIRRIRILPRLMRNVQNNSMRTTVLGMEVDFPIGVSPVGFQKMAHFYGELATAKGLSDMKTIMILSVYSNTRLEEVAKEVEGKPLQLWMQTFIFQNRSTTANIVQRAENSGFKAIVLTVDTNVGATISCDGRKNLVLPQGVKAENINTDFHDITATDMTFKDISWIKSMTSLPIVVKGLLSGDDAVRSILAGASAIFVSNHGGRQLDSSIATIDALPGVVDAVHRFFPKKEVYMDGGVRNGYDVYKALARGARMVFVGRPTVWGLALNGAEGVNKMMNILKNEFNETMLLSGNSSPSLIRRSSLLPQVPVFL